MDDLTRFSYNNTETNYVFAFVFKPMAARFPEISGKEKQKLAERAETTKQSKQSKLLRCEGMFGSRGQKARS